MTDFITVGQIVAPHGVRGDVRIYPQTDFPERFKKMKHAYIDGVQYGVSNARLHKHVVLLKLSGIDDRDGAERLVNKEIQVPIEEAVPLKEGQYYVFDIVGLAVYDLQDKLLGTVTDVLRTGSNDVYVVTAADGTELLLAAIGDVVKSIDKDKKKMVVDPPEWVEE